MKNLCIWPYIRKHTSNFTSNLSLVQPFPTFYTDRDHCASYRRVVTACWRDTAAVARSGLPSGKGLVFHADHFMERQSRGGGRQLKQEDFTFAFVVNKQRWCLLLAERSKQLYVGCWWYLREPRVQGPLLLLLLLLLRVWEPPSEGDCPNAIDVVCRQTRIRCRGYVGLLSLSFFKGTSHLIRILRDDVSISVTRTGSSSVDSMTIFA